MPHLKFIIPGAACGVLLLGYLGLSSYSSSVAEKRLEDWLYDHRLDGMLRWRSLSASPFGGSMTLKDVTLSGGDNFKALDLDIAKVHISDLADERDLKSLALELSGVQIADTRNSRGLSAPLRELLHESGRSELEPFDLALQGRYDARDERASFSFRLALPQLFSSEGSVELRNTRHLDRTLGELGSQVAGISLNSLPSMALLLGLEKSARGLDSIELGEASFSLRDEGYFKRRNALQQRYDYSLDPSKGSADKQRQAIAEREQRQWLKSCEEAWQRAYKKADQACSSWWLAQNGQSKGVRLRLDPESRVRLGDLAEIKGSPERAGRTLERLNLRIDKL